MKNNTGWVGGKAPTTFQKCGQTEERKERGGDGGGSVRLRDGDRWRYRDVWRSYTRGRC
jgi:hypothetical protein